MATVLPAQTTSSLLQRRLSAARHNPNDLDGFMSTFNMSFRPDVAAAAVATASAPWPFTLHHQQQQRYQQSYHLIPSYATSQAPFDLVNPSAVHHTASIGQESSYDYNMAPTYSGGSFGAISWPTQHTSQAFTAKPAMLIRSGSNSSTSSEVFIKSEQQSPVQPPQAFYNANTYASSSDAVSSADSSDEAKPTVFSTDVDTLMQVIQTRPHAEEEEEDLVETTASAEHTRHSKLRKRYLCQIPGCGKAFHQKTHLDIHTRAHTGVKPFLCREPLCGQRFSQLGNLKTHERRHTGERPYHCDICGKTFAQHGNVRAHRIVHTAAKPFSCKLDDCNKQFTQLGNLKSHQNKFHADTIQHLKSRFQNFKDGDVAESWEKELWDYFTGLYKNCNKGIKGRGKDRRISSISPGRHNNASRRDSIVSAGSSKSNFHGSMIGLSTQQGTN